MANFSVKLDEIRSETDNIKNVQNRIRYLKDSVGDTSRVISGTVRNSMNIANRLNSVLGRLDTISQRLGSMSQALQNVDNVVTATELTNLEWNRANVSELPGAGAIISGIQDITLPFDKLISEQRRKIIDLLSLSSPFIVWDTKKWLVEYLLSQPQGSWLGIAKAADEEEVKVDDDSFLASLFEWKFGKDDKDLLNILGVEVTSGTAAAFLGRLQTEDFKGYLLKGYVSSKDKTKTSYDIKDAKDAFEDWAKNKDLYDEFKDVSYYDKDGNKLSQQQGKDVNFMKRQATLYEWEKKVSAGVSVFDGEWDTKIGKVSAKVGDAEAHASISGGFYVVGADGKKKFSPGVKAEIGASATALEIGLENDAIIGNEMLGINGDAKLTLGKIGAKGTATAQIYGEDGKLDLQLDAGVKAEATLAEVEGSLGVNVLGGEVKAKATGSIGIGAHANVGYKDGVIKLDIGASLGIGGSVSLEADIGGMVDTVVSTGKAVVDGIGKAASGVASFVGKAFSWFG